MASGTTIKNKGGDTIDIGTDGIAIYDSVGDKAFFAFESDEMRQLIALAIRQVRYAS